MNKKELYRRLVEEITLIDVNRFSYSDSFRAGEAVGKVKGLEIAKKLLNQLDEPELPVIPQFVADYIEKAKGRHHSLYQAMKDYCDPEVNQWIQGFFHSDTFARAWLDGYTIEKETMYYVIFVESEDEEYGQALYKDFNFNGDKVASTHIETFSKRISLEAGNFHFTEQEIEAIDERYLTFKVEVSK